MATEILATMQGTGETRTHFVDFTNDLPSGVTVSSGTATHTPPSGSAVSCTVGVIVSNVVPVTVPALSVIGRHIVTVNATLSDAEVITARLIIPVQWDTSRTTMAVLISEFRGMVDAGSNDYAIGGIPYWTDKQLQTQLDLHRTYVNHEVIEGLPSYGAANVITYTLYPTNRQYWEDTKIIQDGSGSTLGTSDYTMDLINGLVTFSANQGGSARYITGYTYDMYGAAAAVWNTKAAHFAGKVDWSTDNHSMKRSQLIAHAKQMYQMYASMSAGMAGGVTLDRNDMVTYG